MLFSLVLLSSYAFMHIFLGYAEREFLIFVVRRGPRKWIKILWVLARIFKLGIATVLGSVLTLRAAGWWWSILCFLLWLTAPLLGALLLWSFETDDKFSWKGSNNK